MEAEISSLTVGFVAQMHKRVVNSQGETYPASEGPDDKHHKLTGPTKEVQISPIMISVDSPDRALGALSAMEGNTQGASQETYALLEDGAPAEEPPLADKVTREALPIKEVGGPPPWAR